eukprot:1179183-Prorocentrum_minimum.AAC.4
MLLGLVSDTAAARCAYNPRDGSEPTRRRRKGVSSAIRLDPKTLGGMLVCGVRVGARVCVVLPVAGTNRGRVERIYPYRAPIAEG